MKVTSYNNGYNNNQIRVIRSYQEPRIELKPSFIYEPSLRPDHYLSQSQVTRDLSDWSLVLTDGHPLKVDPIFTY